jgi:hypothetical protein
MRISISIVVLLSLLVSCKPKELDITIPQAEEKLVVASQFLPNSSLAIVISKSFSALKNGIPTIDSNGVVSNEELIVKNASVTLTNGINTYELTEFSPGVYTTEEMNKEDFQQYHVVINHPETGLNASAKTQMMPDILFDSVSVSKQSDAQYPIMIHYSFSDRPNEQNWYVVQYLLKNTEEDVRDRSNFDYIAKRMLEQQNTFDLYTDADFANGKISVSRKIKINEASDTLGIAVSNITYEYYTFLQAQKRSGLLINQLRGEVINFPTNVQNGYGFFNLHKPDVRVMEVQE